ncbi:MAG: sensor histidine kinase [Pontibacterium sp.]
MTSSSPARFLKEHPLAEQIRRELHQTFIQEMVSRMPFSLLTLMAIGYFFNEAHSFALLLSWYAGGLGVGLVSFVILRQHNRFLAQKTEYTYADYQRWRWAIYFVAVLWGGLYSSVSLLFFANASDAEIMTVVVVLILNASVPSMTKGNDPWIYILFVVPVFSCFTWQIYHLKMDQYWLLTVIVPIACLSLIAFSLMTHKSQMEFTALRVLHKEAEMKALKANAEKTRFLGAASHDLRQPLQAIKLYLGAIPPSSLPPQAGVLVDKAKEAASNGHQLLDKLLDISALDGEGIQPIMTPFSLLSLLEVVERQYATLVAKKGLDFYVEKVDVTVCYDEQFLLQILENLLSNAVKFTEAGSVSVSYRLEVHRVLLQIEDTGVGIEQALQNRVFEEFVQGADQQANHQASSASAEQTKGMGLGLSIVKRLCELQEIDFSLESEPQKGTRFTLALKRCPSTA